MYFLDGRSQDDIARVLGTSRVQRVPDARGRHGISGSSRSASRTSTVGTPTLEQALIERFRPHSRPASPCVRPSQDPLAATCTLAAEWLEHDAARRADPRAVVGDHIAGRRFGSGGRDEPRRAEIVPLVGGLSAGRIGRARATSSYVSWQPGSGRPIDCLHGPALLHSDTAREALLAEPSIWQDHGSGQVRRHRDGRHRGIRLRLDHREFWDGLGSDRGPASRAPRAEPGRQHLLSVSTTGTADRSVVWCTTRSARSGSRRSSPHPDGGRGGGRIGEGAGRSSPRCGGGINPRSDRRWRASPTRSSPPSASSDT
jgi:hypothetical protein